MIYFLLIRYMILLISGLTRQSFVCVFFKKKLAGILTKQFSKIRPSFLLLEFVQLLPVNRITASTKSSVRQKSFFNGGISVRWTKFSHPKLKFCREYLTPLWWSSK